MKTLKNISFETLISKIGMLLMAMLAVVMYAVFPAHSSTLVIINSLIGFLVMVLCFIIWSSVCRDEGSDNAESNIYLKRIIVSDYVVAAMSNCFIELYGDARYCFWLYIFNMAMFLAFAMMFLSFGMYMLKLIGDASGKIRFYSRIYYILTGIHALLIVSTPITKVYFYVDKMGAVHYPNTYYLTEAYSVVMLAINLVWIVKHGRSKHGNSILFSCILAWGFGIVSDLFAVWGEIEVISEAMMALLFGVGIIWIFCGIYSKQRQDLLVQKEELTSLRLNAMIAQIEPHFIFNTLGTIDSLCVEDAERARLVIGMFSDYLRANYHSISLHPICSIEQEIEHLKTYTQIEQIRFSRLNICYDIQETQFMIPSFTLQPLVENAIKHGICAKKKSAGTVTIRTYSDDEDYIVTVSDDGVGFDKDSIQDGKVHVGINNVEQRLSILCDGSLVIDSTVGVGTTCTIRVPRA